jgi:hypothetical protein
VHPVHEALDDACEQDLELSRGGGAHDMEHRHARGGAIDPIEYQAMQMDVEIIPGYPCPSPRWGQPTAVQNRSRRFGGGRAETLDQRDGASCGFGALESGMLDQKCGNDPVDDLQYR